MADVTASRDPIELLVVANDEFARRLRLVGPDDWRRPTPCSEWDVRALVNHVVGANVRYQLLLQGAPSEQVEATRTVDHLGGDALASFVATADGVVACFREDGVLERIAHHATGDRTGRELLSMRILDAAIHGWDLARAIGADETLDDDVPWPAASNSYPADTRVIVRRERPKAPSIESAHGTNSPGWAATYVYDRCYLVEVRTAEKQRVEKLLEDAQIKLSVVASDIIGVSGRDMMEHLISYAGRRAAGS